MPSAVAVLGIVVGAEGRQLGANKQQARAVGIELIKP